MSCRPRVRIVSIGVDAPMIDLHKNADNTLEVPQDILVSGWYTGRSVPGELGPSVVVGHVDSTAQGAGVFYRLRELEVGDVITIERSDGSTAEFRVTDSELVLKDEFPTEKVYGSVEGSKLRLITCGGTFDGSARSYLGNVIVYAEHHRHDRDDLAPIVGPPHLAARVPYSPTLSGNGTR